MRPWIWLVASLMIVGCRAPMPWFKPTNTRVPPPATGEFGTADPYYNTTPTQPPSTSAPATKQSKSGSARSVSSSHSKEEGDSELAWTTPRRTIQRDQINSDDRIGATIRRARNTDNKSSQVRQADFETSDDYTPGSTSSSKRIQFKGMPVNDATGQQPADGSGKTATGSWKSRY